MIKFMVPVVRDMIAEHEGIESMVGKQVEIIKKIPRLGRIRMATPGMGVTKVSRVNKDVYLVNAPSPRLMSAKGRCATVMVLYKGYEGNDIYSAEELGVKL